MNTERTVLVVEDEDALRRVLIQTLKKEGYTPLPATDGNEGLQLALQYRPDLIILDIMMPHSGLGMLAQLRQDETYGKTARVILLTNLSPDSSKSILQAIDQYEPAFYLVKANFTPSRVIEKIKEVLG